MKRQIKRLLTVLLCASLLVTVLWGCSKDKVIAVDRVESDGQTITVIYKDGFAFEVNFYSVLTYGIGESYFVSNSDVNKKEESTGTTTTGTITTGTTTTIIGGADFEYSIDPESGRPSITLGGGGVSSVDLGLGVRAMGTNDNPLGVESMLSDIRFSSLSGQGALVRVTETEEEVGLDLAGNGKKYEFYGPYLRDCLIKHLKEATVLGSMSDTQGGETEITCVLSGGFAELTSLEKVVLPGSIKTIYSGAFYRCTSLKTIQYDGTVKQWKEIKKSADWDLESGNYTVYCTDGTVAKGE